MRTLALALVIAFAPLAAHAGDGLAKCFGPKNCHVVANGSTLTALLSEPGVETQSGTNLFKGFDELMAKNKGQMILN